MELFISAAKSLILLQNLWIVITVGKKLFAKFKLNT